VRSRVPERVDVDEADVLISFSVLVSVLRSGCSTLLKTIAGETHGLEVEEGSYINYQGES
jgi:hypothetical protein